LVILIIKFGYLVQLSVDRLLRSLQLRADSRALALVSPYLLIYSYPTSIADTPVASTAVWKSYSIFPCSGVYISFMAN